MSDVARDISAISSNTIVVHAQKMEANALLNITNLAKSHGIKVLRDKFRGVKAVVAGAGPSLDDAIPALKAHQGEYLLLAVDRALKPLLDAGLVPDMVCCADMDAQLATLFEGYEIPESVPLLYDRDCYTGVPRGWKGPLIAYDHYYDVGIWETTFVGHKGVLCKNFTVSHTALYVAATLGCGPIVLAGVDFAYPSVEEHHAKGSVVVENEVKEKAAAHWLDVPGNVLEKVRTTEVFSLCVPTMNAGITEAMVDVVNVSKIGAKIPAARYMPVDEAMALPSEKVDAPKLMAEMLAKDEPHFDPIAFDAQSSHVILAMDRMIELATEGIDLMWRLKRIDGLRNKTLFPKWRSMFLKVIKIRDEMLADTFSQYLLERTMLRTVLEIKKMLAPVKELKELDPKRLVVECSRTTLLFWQWGECSKLFVRCLQTVRQEMGFEPIEVKWQMPPEKKPEMAAVSKTES